MFRAPIRHGIELRLLEERHASAAFALMDRDREHLRQWLAFVDKTRTEEDWRKFVRAPWNNSPPPKGSPPESGRASNSLV